MKWSTNSWHTSHLPTSSGFLRWEHCELPILWDMRRNSAKWLLYPHAYCGASTLLFLHPSPFPTLLQSSFFLFHPNICSSTLYYLSTYILQCMKRTNFLKCIGWTTIHCGWMEGFVVVVIVPFSIHWLLYMCAFSYVSELFSWGKRAEK